jgi:hypothetical protein
MLFELASLRLEAEQEQAALVLCPIATVMESI